MRALISDIHSNLEAFRAVLSDIAARGASEIHCLGDIVGYGPNPKECIDLARRCQVCILGNHDHGALYEPENFHAGAERAIIWTRQQLESGLDSAENARRWEFLGELDRRAERNGVLYVHGSPRRPLSEYVFPEDIFNQPKMSRLFELVNQVCFEGHTHVPGVFTEDLEFFPPEQVGYRYKLERGRKALINIGSVGQPRDRDPRACYVLFDGEAVEWRRVPYEFESTRQKIYAIDQLDNFFGDRLREGR
jgi:predicted phosphodiesterase